MPNNTKIKKTTKKDLQTKDILKIIKALGGKIVEFRYGELYIKTKPYQDSTNFEVFKPQHPLEGKQIPQKNTPPTQSQKILDEELEMELVGITDPSSYFDLKDKERRKRGKVNRGSTRE